MAVLYGSSSADKLPTTIRKKMRCFMVVRGHVQNGVVVLDDGVQIPEGQTVSVFVPLPANQGTHSVLDIPPVSIGAVLRPLTSEDDLLGEMLEDRT
jgi:hypothetical protein